MSLVAQIQSLVSARTVIGFIAENMENVYAKTAKSRLSKEQDVDALFYLH
jgi:hypothetical protein